MTPSTEVQLEQLRGQQALDAQERKFIRDQMSDLATGHELLQKTVNGLVNTMDSFLVEAKWLHRIVGFFVLSVAGGAMTYYLPKIFEALSHVI